MAHTKNDVPFLPTPFVVRDRCCVAPSPQLRERIVTQLRELRGARDLNLGGQIVIQPQKRPGFNDGLIVPGSEFPLGTPLHVVRSAAATRAPLRGSVRAIIVLAQFPDAPMKATPAHAPAAKRTSMCELCQMRSRVPRASSASGASMRHWRKN